MIKLRYDSGTFSLTGLEHKEFSTIWWALRHCHKQCVFEDDEGAIVYYLYNKLPNIDDEEVLTDLKVLKELELPNWSDTIEL